jgi:hypothetical protein
MTGIRLPAIGDQEEQPRGTGGTSGYESTVFHPTSGSLNSLLTALFFFGVGTGGRISLASAAPLPSTPRGIVVAATISAPGSALPGITVQERLWEIRSALSLNMQQVANAIRVGRPSVYSWLANRSTPRRAQLQRIKVIHDVARKWTELSQASVGKHVSTPLQDGRSLSSLLTEKKIDLAAVQSAMATVHSAIRREAERKLSYQYRRVSDVAREKGFPEAERKAKERRIRSESRRSGWS